MGMKSNIFLNDQILTQTLNALMLMIARKGICELFLNLFTAFVFKKLLLCFYQAEMLRKPSGFNLFCEIFKLNVIKNSSKEQRSVWCSPWHFQNKGTNFVRASFNFKWFCSSCSAQLSETCRFAKGLMSDNRKQNRSMS